MVNHKEKCHAPQGKHARCTGTGPFVNNRTQATKTLHMAVTHRAKSTKALQVIVSRVHSNSQTPPLSPPSALGTHAPRQP